MCDLQVLCAVLQARSCQGACGPVLVTWLAGVLQLHSPRCSCTRPRQQL